MFAAARGARALWLVPSCDHDRIAALSDTAYRDHVLRFLAHTIGAAPR